jgi:hypothetical protein
MARGSSVTSARFQVVPGELDGETVLLIAYGSREVGSFVRCCTWVACRLDPVPENGTRPDPRRSGLVVLVVVGTGVDPVTFRFSGGRSAN